MSKVSIYIGKTKDGEEVSWVPKKEKNPHLLVVGTSGSGKTVTLRSIVYELSKHKIPSLIIDFHNDFDVLAENMLDFTNTTINPLDFSGGESAETVMYKVSSILGKIFRLGVQQEGSLQDAIMKSYRDRGIGLKDTKHKDNLPTFDDVRNNLEEKIFELREERRPSTTVETLMVRLRPLFDTGFFSDKKTAEFSSIFKKTTVLKLRDLPTDEVKYAVAEFFLNKLKYALYEKGKTDKLVLYTIVDEAHRLLDEKSPLNDLLRESRKYGTGVLMASQRPGDFSETVLANIGGTAAFQCRFEKDAKFISKQMAVEQEDIQNLTEIGTAYINFSSEDTTKLVKVLNFDERVKGKLPANKIKKLTDESKKTVKKVKDKIVKKDKVVSKKDKEDWVGKKEEPKEIAVEKKPEERDEAEKEKIDSQLDASEYGAKIIYDVGNNPVKWFFRGWSRLWHGADLLTQNRNYKIGLILIITLLLLSAGGGLAIPIILAAIILIGARG